MWMWGWKKRRIKRWFRVQARRFGVLYTSAFNQQIYTYVDIIIIRVLLFGMSVAIIIQMPLWVENFRSPCTLNLLMFLCFFHPYNSTSTSIFKILFLVYIIIMDFKPQPKIACSSIVKFQWTSWNENSIKSFWSIKINDINLCSFFEKNWLSHRLGTSKVVVTKMMFTKFKLFNTFINLNNLIFDKQQQIA